MPGLDITGYKSLPQHSEGLTVKMERQRKGEALQGDKTNCFKDTADRNEAINYYNKCPLLVILPHFLVIIIIHSVITHAGVTLAEGPASRECYKSSEDEVGGYEDLKK